MKSRRKFIHQSGLTAAALLALKPIDSFSTTLPVYNSFFSGNNDLMLLHTSQISTQNQLTICNTIKTVKSQSSNSLYLHACNNDANLLVTASDVSLADLENKEYKIVYRGKIKLGIISTTNNNPEIYKQVNAISKYLKNDRGCNLVICISHLGYKNTNGIDDIGLAANSQNLDVILTSHPTNYLNKTFIATNSKKEEVIINHATVGKQIDLGKIIFSFDERGSKKNIQFIRK